MKVNEDSKIYTAASLSSENPEKWNESTLAEYFSVTPEKIKEWQQTSVWQKAIKANNEATDELEQQLFSNYNLETKNQSSNVANNIPEIDDYSIKIENYKNRLDNCADAFLSILEKRLNGLNHLHQIISETELSLKEELEVQKQLDLSFKNLASASMFVVELKEVGLQVSELLKKLRK